MRTFYHCLIMWGPFGLLFSLAGCGLLALDGEKIITSDFKLIYIFGVASFVFILYPVTFLPLTFIVSKFVKSLLFKVVIFTFFGGAIGALAINIIYDSRYIEEYSLSIITPIIIFGIAGLLYAFLENSIKKNIKFV